MEQPRNANESVTQINPAFWWAYDRDGDGDTIGFYSTLEKALAGVQRHMEIEHEITDEQLELYECEAGFWRNGVYERKPSWGAGGYGFELVDSIDFDMF